MKTLNRPYADKRLHSQLKGQKSIIKASGEFGKIEVMLVNGKYKVTAVNKETKQHFVNTFATLPGAMVCFDTMKAYWI